MYVKMVKSWSMVDKYDFVSVQLDVNKLQLHKYVFFLGQPNGLLSYKCGQYVVIFTAASITTSPSHMLGINEVNVPDLFHSAIPLIL